MNLRRSTLAVACVLSLSALPLLANAAAPANPASSDDGLYAGLMGGVGFTPNFSGIKFKKPGYQAGGQIGYKIGPMRYEGELAYLRSNVNGTPVKMETTLAMVNAIYDIHQLDDSLPFTPYVGAGVGYGHYKLATTNGTNFSGSTNKATAQGIVGASMPITDQTNLFVDYRYVSSLGKLDGTDRYQNHTLNAGINYHFDL